jgi:hypothetical protein
MQIAAAVFFAVTILLCSGCSTWKRLRGDSAAQSETRIAPVLAERVLRLKGAKAEEGVVRIDRLQFQQCAFGQKPTARVCVGDAVSMNHFRADDYCKRLNLENQRWRLPTREELEGILLSEQPFVPLTDPEIFPGTPAMMFWTGSAFHGANSSFWTVDFHDGRSRGETIFKNAYVRCVSES